MPIGPNAPIGLLAKVAPWLLAARAGRVAVPGAAGASSPIMEPVPGSKIIRIPLDRAVKARVEMLGYLTSPSVRGYTENELFSYGSPEARRIYLIEQQVRGTPAFGETVD